MDTILSTRTSRTRQSGMSLIELMIALVVLVVGMLALMTMVTTAISSNNRAKVDTTGTMLAQTVLEGIVAQPATQNTTFSLKDCNPAGATTFTLATAPGAQPNGNGAPLVAATGNIDFTQAVVANYNMLYVACGSGGTQATYDVRWNVMTLTNFTKLVTVSARQRNIGNLPFFFPPITLRTIAGQ